MTANLIAFERPTVEDLYDAYVAAGNAYRACPTADGASRVSDAYARFYRAFNKSSAGLDAAMAALWLRMDERMKQARTG